MNGREIVTVHLDNTALIYIDVALLYPHDKVIKLGRHSNLVHLA
jgi:hypothetical protein